MSYSPRTSSGRINRLGENTSRISRSGSTPKFAARAVSCSVERRWGTGPRAAAQDRHSAVGSTASIREARWLENLSYFAEKWGARVGRSVKRSKLDRTALCWAPKRSGTIGITLTDARRSAGWGDWYTAHELGGRTTGR